MRPPALAVEDLEVRHGAVNAVRGLSFEVGHGEIVGLIGPNGAGKSSTLHAIMGAVRPTGGDVRVNGASVVGRRPEDVARIREGFAGEARGPVVEEMRAAHAAMVDAIAVGGEEDFTRKAAVVYGSGDPYPTSPSDVVGWVADHCREHTQQIGDLVSAWAEATR